MCLILNQIIEIDKMSVQNNDKYILDTNVLIKLFYPSMNDHNVKPYIEIYQKLLIIVQIFIYLVFKSLNL